MTEAVSYETKAQADETPERKFRRWNLEITLAKKRERDWRKTAQDIWKKYRAKDRKKASFNILWANTDTLRPALYNSPPKPDVRRRFRQGDMLGKAVGEVTERALSYCADAFDIDTVIKQDVLEALLPGRGVSRVRYVPSFKAVGTTPEAHEAEGELSEQETTHEAFEGNQEEVEFEKCLMEHVQWDAFLHGPGKTWDEVPWVAFEHKLRRDDLTEKFGEEIGGKIELDASDDDDLQRKENEDIAGVFKRAELWEIWDKDSQKVFFLAPSYKEGLLYPLGEGEQALAKGEPPLKLKNFFPCPRPLALFEDTGTLVPTPLFELYREQAVELDRVSERINKVVNACRVRFGYDPTLTELSELMKSDDNEGIPVSNARAWINNGGLEKAIWWMPIEQLVKVLQQLYVARDQCKATIYELTAISDIMRGETDPNETLGAQQLKANYASGRLARMQKEVQRYVRDCIRLMVEVIGEHFEPQTLATMTGMQFPTQQQKQMLMLQAQGAQQSGQPVTPELQNALSLPTWEEIKGVLSSDMQREFRVDVETNSTIAETLSQDMQGLKEVVGGLTEFWNGVGAAVQAGALSIEAVRAISLSIVRRARLGLEVEDAIERGLQQPKQTPDPKAQADAQQKQIDQMQAQHQAQLDAQAAQHDAAIKEREQQLEAAKAQHEAMLAEKDREIEAANQIREDDFQRWKVEQDNATKLEVARMGHDAQIDAAFGRGGDDAEQPRKTPRKMMEEMHGNTQAGLQQLADMLSVVHERMETSDRERAERDSEPTAFEYGPDGRVAAVIKGKTRRAVVRNNGRMTGLQ